MPESCALPAPPNATHSSCGVFVCVRVCVRGVPRILGRNYAPPHQRRRNILTYAIAMINGSSAHSESLLLNTLLLTCMAIMAKAHTRRYTKKTATVMATIQPKNPQKTKPLTTISNEYIRLIKWHKLVERGAFFGPACVFVLLLLCSCDNTRWHECLNSRIHPRDRQEMYSNVTMSNGGGGTDKLCAWTT